MGFSARLAAVFCAIFLVGCGQLPTEQQGAGQRPGPAGVYTDTTLAEYLEVRFGQVKTCSGLTEGHFQELSVVMMAPVFTCPWYADGCDGEFVPPNIIKLGHPYSWDHEVIHYLLFVNTGSADSGHSSELFTRFCPS
ncbi:MAG: hypothetical protein OEY97_04360 [Nitrospirota bacterium]|nr:hypothetical protein [Nitrospirota bacterium]